MDWTALFIRSGGGSIENKSVAHIENTTPSIVVFTAPMHSNGRYQIVTFVFVLAGMCLPSLYPATYLHIK
jgi:hypothetical protein